MNVSDIRIQTYFLLGKWIWIGGIYLEHFKHNESECWGGESLILRCFGRGGGGVPLVYDITKEKINCNGKQAKKMKRKKEKYKNDTNR